MKTVLIIAGIIAVLLVGVFLWLLVAGADESRRRDRGYSNKRRV